MLDKKLNLFYTIALYVVIVALASVPIYVLNEVLFK
jgi:hypothetical protein